jgi:hypothetical protein
VAALAAILLAFRLVDDGDGHAIAWTDLTSQVGPLRIDRSERRLFRKPSSLARYLQRAKATRPPPAVDFSARQLLLVSTGPRSSTGYDVEILSARENGDEIDVRVRERAPGLDEAVAPRVTYPYRLVSLPAGKDVFVDWVGR